ncbi:MAG TPA: matrixin family metalloprotease [Anaeromyxobacteraceae bacterium]|nr:matrixin family metalloprotease [Anaeromyxobacteraceae bacterium]
MRWLPLALALAVPAAARPYVRTTTQSSNAPCPGGTAHPLAWRAFPVPFVVDAAGSADIPGSSAFDAVGASFATWAAPACTGLRFRDDGTVANVPVGFRPAGPNVNAVKWIESGWTESAQAIAVTFVTFSCDTGEMLDADITLNGQNFTFAVSPGPTAIDLQSTVTHEAGHVIGFDHNPDPESTMYATAGFGETKKRSLTDDDIAGVCDAYPADAPPPPAPAAAPRGGGGCSSAGVDPTLAAAAIAALAARRRVRPRRLEDGLGARGSPG